MPFHVNSNLLKENYPKRGDTLLEFLLNYY